MVVSTENTTLEEQLVVFDLASEAYGVDIGAVREIIRMQDITKVPRTPDFVEGVINLRGKVIPVVDLRKRFDLPVPEKQSKDNRIVVVDIGGQDIGVMVDAVTEVLRIATDSVAPPSSVITGTDSDYLLGIVKLESRLIILLDLEKVLSEEEKANLFDDDADAATPLGE
ncbi:MAG: chemotaxis protein CheW [Chloroflexi bacterium]|nr:chemotaxis protein CheW [Chloroflexota bacterium]